MRGRPGPFFALKIAHHQILFSVGVLRYRDEGLKIIQGNLKQVGLQCARGRKLKRVAEKSIDISD